MSAQRKGRQCTQILQDDTDRTGSPADTSYPTAPHFNPTIREVDYRRWLKSITPRRPASIYLHVPFCRSTCWYCGCHTSISKRDDPIAVYASGLRTEAHLVADTIGHRQPISHIHFGGGTPAIMTPDTFADLVGALFLLRAARRRDRRGDRPADFDRAHVGSSGFQRRQPREPRRSKLRSGGPVRDQSPPELRSDYQVRRIAATRRNRESELRLAVRLAASDDGLVPGHRRQVHRAEPRPVLGVRLRAYSLVQEAPAQDRRGSPARQHRASPSVRSDRGCTRRCRLRADRL